MFRCSHGFCHTQEAERGEFDVMAADMRTGQLIVNEPRVKVDLKQYTERHVFNFDAVLDENVDNDAVYRCIPSHACGCGCRSVLSSLTT